MSFSLQTSSTESYSIICVDGDGDVIANYAVKGEQTDPSEALKHVQTLLGGLNGEWSVAKVNGSVSQRKPRGTA